MVLERLSNVRLCTLLPLDLQHVNHTTSTNDVILAAKAKGSRDQQKSSLIQAVSKKRRTFNEKQRQAIFGTEPFLYAGSQCANRLSESTY